MSLWSAVQRFFRPRRPAPSRGTPGPTPLSRLPPTPDVTGHKRSPPIPTDSLTLTVLRLRAEHFRETYWRHQGRPTFDDFLRYLIDAADTMDDEAQKLAAELADLNQRLRDP